MLRPEPRGALQDIADAIERIERHISGRDRAAFLVDETICDAVGMQLLVIGEAVRRLPTEVLAEAAEIPWRRIVALRNRIAHGYASLNWAVVWDIASIELLPLKEAVHELLAKHFER